MSILTRPLVLGFLAYLAGLLPGLRFGLSPGVFALLAAGLALAAFIRNRRDGFTATPLAAARPAELLLALALVCGGLAAGGATHRDMLADCRLRLRDGVRLEVEGVLLASVVPGARSETFTPRYPLRAARVVADGVPLAGCTPALRARVPASLDGALAGAHVRLVGSWRAAPAPDRPSRWPADPRFAGSLTADTASQLAAPALRANPLLTLRGRAERNLHRLFPNHGGLADALLLGRRETLDPALRDRYTRAGLVHLLAISGAHVGLIAAALLLLGRAARLSHRAVGWLTIGLLAGYLAMIGAPASALRAGTMIVLALLAYLLQRPTAPLVAVTAAAWLILAAAPGFALDIGFQLSVAGVAGILLALGWLEPWLQERGRDRGPVGGVLRAACVSAAAFVATAPIVVFHFGQLAPVSLLSNLPAMPLMAVALAGVAAAAVLGAVAQPLGRLVADGAGFVLDVLDGVATVAAAVPGGYVDATRAQLWSWLAAAAALLLTAWFAARLRRPVRGALAVSAAALVLLAWPASARVGGGALELHFIDVGQGDAVAIRSPAGRWALVDAGPRDDRYDAGQRRVVPFLRARGARAVEVMVLTHPHLDHIGGAPAVMRALPVRYLVEPGLAVGSPAYLETLETAERLGVAWREGVGGRTLELDGVVLQLLWPDSVPVDGVSDANEISIVVRLQFGDFVALLMGDAYADVEHRLIERHGPALHAQLLKAGHHGSRTSTSDAWLDAVRPELVVVSAARRNRYGHPSPEVLERLAARGIEIARTDREGTVSVRVARAGGGRWSRIE